MTIPDRNFIEVFKTITGAFSVAEAIALYNICLDAPDGTWMELGSHKGKSSSVIAYAMKGKNGKFLLIEPEFKDTAWLKEVAAKLDFDNTKVTFSLYADYSLNFIERSALTYSFVFVDSGVHDDMVMEEVKMLEDKVVQGGIIAFHDYLNQFSAVERAYNYLLSTGKFEPIGIDWQPIFDYVNEHNDEADNNSWHTYPELPHPPNFVGAVKRK